MEINLIKDLYISYSLFLKQTKIKTLVIIVFSIILMLLEILSIGILVPLVSVLLMGIETTKNSLFENFYFDELINFLFSNVFYFIFFIFFVFLLKNIFFLYVSYYQLKYFEDHNQNLSNSLFSNYLKKNYVFFLNQNIADTLRNLRNEVGSSILYLRSLIGILSEGLIILGLLFFLIYTNFLITISVLVIFIPIVYIFYFYTKNKILNLGNERIILDGLLNKSIIQGIKSIREIKLSGKEKIFLNDFKKIVNEIKINNLIINFIGLIPRAVLEIIIVGLILSAIIFLKYLNVSEIETITVLTIFSLSSIRMLPSINRIILHLQQLRFRNASLKLINNEFNSYFSEKTPVFLQRNKKNQLIQKVTITDLSFGYNKNEILKDINIELNQNDVLGVVGATGSGKSTFLDLLTGLLDPKKGSISIDGIDMKSIKDDWQNQIAYVSQKIYLMDESIEKNISFELKTNLIDRQKLQESIFKAEMKEFIDKLELKERTVIGENAIKLSGGQIQRIAIARALYQNKQVLVLDESTSALDEKTEEKNFK